MVQFTVVKSTVLFYRNSMLQLIRVTIHWFINHIFTIMYRCRPSYCDTYCNHNTCVLSCKTHGNVLPFQDFELRKCINREIKLFFFICWEPPVWDLCLHILHSINMRILVGFQLSRQHQVSTLFGRSNFGTYSLSCI